MDWPRLTSLRGVDVAGLQITKVNLRICRFAGTRNLDQLQIEGEALFARARGWWHARRRLLADEVDWRLAHLRPWSPRGWHHQDSPLFPSKPTTVLASAQIAALYRELRKEREDAKDEPGAADFYYGECEMRRHDTSAPIAERLVLWFYWFLSGYGLRAWRAVTALVLLIVLAGIGFASWGFPNTVDLSDAIRFSARSATALLRGPDQTLTPSGEWLEIGLRLAGPLLLGLAIVSIRGRVRR
jgi:hypothetical protein